MTSEHDTLHSQLHCMVCHSAGAEDIRKCQQCGIRGPHIIAAHLSTDDVPHSDSPVLRSCSDASAMHKERRHKVCAILVALQLPYHAAMPLVLGVLPIPYLDCGFLVMHAACEQELVVWRELDSGHSRSVQVEQCAQQVPGVEAPHVHRRTVPSELAVASSCPSLHEGCLECTAPVCWQDSAVAMVAATDAWPPDWRSSACCTGLTQLYALSIHLSMSSAVHSSQPMTQTDIYR